MKKEQKPASLAEKIFIHPLDMISRTFGVLSAAIMVFCAVLVIVAIFCRIIGRPLLRLSDIITYLIVIFVYLSLADSFNNKQHIACDVLVTYMNSRMKALMSAIGNVFATCCCGLLAYYFVFWAKQSYDMGELTSGMAALPAWPTKLIAAVSIILLTLVALKLCIVDFIKFFANSDGVPRGRGLNNPWIVVPVFLALFALSLWLLTVSPILGLVVLLLTLLMSGLPISISILATAVLVMRVCFGQAILSNMPMLTFSYANKFTLLSLPLFIFAGSIMAEGGLGEDLFDFCGAWVGHIRGGMGISVVLACLIFGALSGSSSACCLAIGSIAFPSLIKNGYSKATAAGLIAVASGLGILIPPSNPQIVFGQLTDTAISKLFIGGIVPGILCGALLIGALLLTLHKEKNVVTIPKVSLKNRLLITKKSIFAILMPILILGGIYSGIFAINEAAAVAVIYALAYSLIRRTIRVRDIWKLTVKCARTMAFILFVLMCSPILQKGVALMRLPNKLMALLADVPAWQFLIVLCLFTAVLGMFVDGASIQAIVIPLAAPILVSYGYDLVWYGALNIALDMVGKVTPPVGMNLFMLQKIGETDAATVFRGAMPYVLAVVILVILLCFFPGLATWLPNTMA